MPIRPENRSRYPANWRDVRAAILARAAQRCEYPGCDLPNGAWVVRDKSGVVLFHSDCEDAARDYRRTLVAVFAGARDPVRVVLTVAHLDHTPEHCDPENLRALCQLHHLRHDSSHHVATRRKTRRLRALRRSGQRSLFDE